jgi:2-acylglycerol O-acyltransferase 2
MLNFLDESQLYCSIKEKIRAKERMLSRRMKSLRIDMGDIMNRNYSVLTSRTLQFLSVATVTVLIWGSAFLLLGLILVSIFSDRPYIQRMFLVCYWLYVVNDRAPCTGGRSNAMFRKSTFWNYFRDYFPSQVIKQNESVSFSSDHKYMIGYHPHGISGLGCFAAFGGRYREIDEIFPQIELFGCTLASNFNVPILREFLLAMGGISVSEESIKAVLNRGPGNAVILVPGGASEALHAKPGTHELTLRRRNGFFRIAIETGAYIVPAYSFGENELFDQYFTLQFLNHWMVKTVGFFFPLYAGYGSIPMNPVPKRRPIITVIGEPIAVEKKLDPSIEDIESLKSEYIENLSKIFDQFADVYAPLRNSNFHIAE